MTGEVIGAVTGVEEACMPQSKHHLSSTTNEKERVVERGLVDKKLCGSA
jgi:hypothetical protein